jgi:hypothetical protein
MNFDTVKMTAMVNGYSLLKIPLLAFITPRIVEVGETRAVIRVRLDWRTRNHLNVMYFGALSMGAELSVATKALSAISASGKKIDFIFKDFQAEFLKRADGHVHFVCEQGREIVQLIQRAASGQERQTQTFSGYAFVPERSDEPIMNYKLTLSLKQRLRKS